MDTFLGARAALAFSHLWFDKPFARRRVDSLELIDRSLLNHRISIDYSANEIDRVWNTAHSEGRTNGRWKGVFDRRRDDEFRQVVPLLTISKQIFFDIDVRDRTGAALHLCRRHVNRTVTAHIIIGSLLRSRTLRPEFANAAFDQIAFAIANDNGAALRSDVVQAIATTSGFRGQIDPSLEAFLRTLKHSFVQCVRLMPIVATKEMEDQIVKMRITTLRSEPPEGVSREQVAIRVTAPSTVRSADIPSGSTERARVSHVVTQALGIVASRIEIRAPGLGSGYRPCHVRLLAPKGVSVEDFEIIDPTGATVSRTNFDIERQLHIDRVAILDRGLNGGDKEFVLAAKINPKRALVFPHLASGLLLFAFMLCSIALGSGRWTANSAMMTGGLFILPSVTAALAIRDAEHEMVGRILGLSRLILVSACGAALLSGLAIATTPDSATETFSLKTPHAAITLVMVLGGTAISGASAILWMFQIIRIEALRKYVATRETRLQGATRNRDTLAAQDAIRGFDDDFSTFRTTCKTLLAVALLLLVLFLGGNGGALVSRILS